MMLAYANQSKCLFETQQPSFFSTLHHTAYDNLVHMKHFKFIVVYFVHYICLNMNNYARKMGFPKLVSHFNHFQDELISKSSDIFELEKIS